MRTVAAIPVSKVNEVAKKEQISGETIVGESGG